MCVLLVSWLLPHFESRSFSAAAEACLCNSDMALERHQSCTSNRGDHLNLQDGELSKVAVALRNKRPAPGSAHYYFTSFSVLLRTTRQTRCYFLPLLFNILLFLFPLSLFLHHAGSVPFMLSRHLTPRRSPCLFRRCHNICITFLIPPCP